MDTSALTNIPPKRLAIIAIVGVGGGLLWRHFSSKKNAVATDATGTPIDLSKLALAQNSAGNLGAAQTEPLPNVNDATRDMGSGFFPIPVTKGVTHGVDGRDYYVDANGTILGPVIVGAAPPLTQAEADSSAQARLQAWWNSPASASFHSRYRIDDAGTGIIML